MRPAYEAGLDVNDVDIWGQKKNEPGPPNVRRHPETLLLNPCVGRYTNRCS